MKNTRILRLTCGLALAALIACKPAAVADNDGLKEDVAENAGLRSDLEAVFVSAAPEKALTVSEVFTDPTPGREVVISGEVMGAMNPFVTGRAMMVIGDPTKITPCNRRPGDQCETPWDVCCDDPDVIKKSIATIQVVGEDGRPLKESLQKTNGIDFLSYVTVKGTIAEGSNPRNLLIDAQKIHVAEKSPYKDAPPVE